MRLQSVGIIGYGAFGILLKKLLIRFAPNIEVRVHSSRHEPDGEEFFTIEQASASDVVIIAKPTREFESTLSAIIPHVLPSTIIVDIATVKQPTLAALRTIARGRKYIACHPMFGPESYENRGHDVTGFKIAICDTTLSNDEYAMCVDLLKGCGFEIVEIPAAEHDAHIARSLFVAQYVSRVLDEAGITRTDIDTVAFQSLMDAVESARGPHQIFKDVYDLIPECQRVLELIEQSTRVVREGLVSRSSTHAPDTEQ